MEIKTPISKVSQEKLKPCGLFRAIQVRISSSTIISYYILVTTLSINGVSDFVVGPKMRNLRVTTARREILLIPAYQLADVFFIPMEADLSICFSSVGLNSKQT